MKIILSIAGLIFVTNILAQNNLVQNTTILEETYEIEAINDDVITKYAHLLDSLFESGIPAELTITVNPTRSRLFENRNEMLYNKMLSIVIGIEDNRKSVLRNIFLRRKSAISLSKPKIEFKLTQYTCI